MKLQKNNKSEKYCERWLKYGENLWNYYITVIFTQRHLYILLGFAPIYAYGASNAPENFYRYYDIPNTKKSGGKREIAEPLPNLEEIQRWILENILYNFEVSPYAKAYIKREID